MCTQYHFPQRFCRHWERSFGTGIVPLCQYRTTLLLSCSGATLIPDACCSVSITGWRPTQGGTQLGRRTAGKVCIPSAVTHHISDAAHTSHTLMRNCCAIMQYVKTCVCVCVCKAVHMGRGVFRVDAVQMQGVLSDPDNLISVKYVIHYTMMLYIYINDAVCSV